MMNFVFPSAVQAAIEAGKYVQVYTSAGTPIGMARDVATGKFVAHAVGAAVDNNPLSPFLSPMQFVFGGLQPQQMQMGFQGVQASLGLLQATTAVIGVGTFAGVALSAVNLYQTLKLKKAVERLEVKVENGFINLEQLLKDQGTEIKQLIFQVLEEMKFENHRLVLVRAYGLFNQALQRMRSALKLQDFDRRNAEIDAARGMMFEALADYRNSQLLEETCAAGQLRRLECAWAIDQAIIATYQLQNELETVSDRICQLQENIRQDGLRIIDTCNSDDELDFIFPEITRIHNHDLVLLDSWHHQIEWTKTLPSSELKQLQTADFSSSQISISENGKSAKTALPIPTEQLNYEYLKPKSHFYSLCTQLELMLEPQHREEYESYIIKQGEVAGYKSLVSSNLEKASNLAIANFFYYFRVRDKSDEEKLKDKIYEKVKTLVSNKLEIDANEVTQNTKLTKKIGADHNADFGSSYSSKAYLNKLELMLAFEEEFDIEIPDEDAQVITKVYQAVDYIYQKISASATATLTEQSCASDHNQQKIPETTEASIKEDLLAIKEFGLTLEEAKIMFSYQYHLVQDDIDQESDYRKKSLKQEWLHKWEKSTTLFLNSQIAPHASHNRSLKLVTNFQLLKKFVQSHLISPGNELTRHLILLELTLFQPYYPLGESNDKFKSLNFVDEERLIGKLRFFAGKLEINTDLVSRFKSNYKEAIKGIKGGINPLLINSFGMAGGMAVIVAGGLLLGAGAGVGVGALFGQSPDAALTQAAKLEVVMREILFMQKDSRKAQEIIKPQEIIKQLRLGIRSLEDQRDELLLNREKNQKEIENLTKAIEYLKKALERLQGLM